MTRRALAVAVLALLTGAPLFAGLGGNKVTYVAGTIQGLSRRTEGRMNTWNLTALNFTPDSRGTKPVTIEYKSITALEYGRTPGRSLGTPASFVSKQHFLTIVYLEPEAKAEMDPKKKLTREQEKERQRVREKEERERGTEKPPESIAVFELGAGIVRPTLRILEARSGKRIRYQDAAARRLAR